MSLSETSCGMSGDPIDQRLSYGSVLRTAPIEHHRTGALILACERLALRSVLSEDREKFFVVGEVLKVVVLGLRRRSRERREPFPIVRIERNGASSSVEQIVAPARQLGRGRIWKAPEYRVRATKARAPLSKPGRQVELGRSLRAGGAHGARLKRTASRFS